MISLDNKLVEKLELFLILLIIISLPFFCIPVYLRIPFLGHILVYYMLFLITILFVLFDKRPCDNKYFKRYILFGVFWGLFTIINGIIFYPYYDNVSVEQSEKVIRLLSVFQFIDRESNILKMLIMFMRSTKIFLVDFIAGPFIMYVVYNCFSKYDIVETFTIFRKFVLCLIFILSIFSVPEVLYYKFHLLFGRDVMIFITSLIQNSSEKYLDWWPPLIWPNEQLRSVCTEPGLFGGIFGFTIPFLFSYCVDYFNLRTGFSYFYYIVITVMTQARTSVCMLCFFLSCLVYSIFSFKFIRKKLLLLLLVFVIGLVFGVTSFGFINFSDQSDEYYSYYVKNIESVIQPGSRSNGSRLKNIKYTVSVGMDHFLTGVGVGLKDYYMIDKLNNEDLKEGEIKAIFEGIKQKGVFKVSFGNVNQYAVWLATQGVVGLMYYLSPFFLLLYIVIKKGLLADLKYFTVFISIIASLLNMMVSGISPFYFMTLGIAFSMLNSEKHL